MSDLHEGETYGEYLKRENRRHARNREMFFNTEKAMTVHEEIQARREQAEIEEHQARLQYEDMLRERDEWARKFAALGQDKGAPPSATVKVYAHKVPMAYAQCENDILLRQYSPALNTEQYRCLRCRFNLWMPILPPMEMTKFTPDNISRRQSSTPRYTNVRVTSDGRNWHTL